MNMMFPNLSSSDESVINCILYDYNDNIWNLKGIIRGLGGVI